MGYPRQPAALRAGVLFFFLVVPVFGRAAGGQFQTPPLEQIAAQELKGKTSLSPDAVRVVIPEVTIDVPASGASHHLLKFRFIKGKHGERFFPIPTGIGAKNVRREFLSFSSGQYWDWQSSRCVGCSKTVNDGKSAPGVSDLPVQTKSVQRSIIKLHWPLNVPNGKRLRPEIGAVYSDHFPYRFFGGIRGAFGMTQSKSDKNHASDGYENFEQTNPKHTQGGGGHLLLGGQILLSALIFAVGLGFAVCGFQGLGETLYIGRSDGWGWPSLVCRLGGYALLAMAGSGVGTLMLGYWFGALG